MLPDSKIINCFYGDTQNLKAFNSVYAMRCQNQYNMLFYISFEWETVKHIGSKQLLRRKGEITNAVKVADKSNRLEFYSPMAATGKQLKQSVNVFHNLMLYRLLHSS